MRLYGIWKKPWRILNKCSLRNNYTSLFTMALKTRKFNGVDFWFKLWIDVITLWSLKHLVIYEYFYRFPSTFRFSMTLILWSGRFLPLCKGKKEEKQRTREGSINFEKPRSWLKHADEADYNRIWIQTWEYRFQFKFNLNSISIPDSNSI